MNTGITFQSEFLGPLLNEEEVDQLWKKIVYEDSDLSYDFHYQMLKAFFKIDVELFQKVILDRYLEVTQEEFHLTDFPIIQPFTEKFITPLQSAKRCYCFGEFLATLELCAHIAEMLAQLLWESHSVTKGDEPLSRTDEKNIFGNKFEKLSQSRRLKILLGFNIINNDLKQTFDTIRKLRNEYYHLWSKEVKDIQLDSQTSFAEICKLIKDVFEIDLDGDNPSMNAHIFQFIKGHK